MLKNHDFQFPRLLKAKQTNAAHQRAQVIGPFQLHIVFSDGQTKSVDVLPLLTGPIFEPLRDQEYFAKVEIDPDARLWYGQTAPISHLKLSTR